MSILPNISYVFLLPAHILLASSDTIAVTDVLTCVASLITNKGTKKSTAPDKAEII